MLLNWSKEYEFGLKEIDEQHKQLVQTLNEVYQLLLAGKSGDDLKPSMDGIIAFANLHFSTEEKYFDQFHYEGKVEHKIEHEKLKQKIAYYYQQIITEKKDLAFELLDFLEDWLVEHLAQMDKKYVQCFKDNGLGL